MEKRFKIIKILDSFTVLIDGGVLDGVTDGMVFKIIAKKIDLNSDDTPAEGYIDPIELYKGKITVKSSYDKTALCKSTSKNNTLNMATALMMQSTPALDVDNREMSGSLPQLKPEERIIHVGDEVVNYSPLN